jgi:transcriptional regulator with XRE-family HTH domain
MPKDTRLLELVKNLIKERGKTDVEIASELGISSQRLGQYKNGKREPGIDFAAKWQKVYGEDIVEMYLASETNVSRGTEKPTLATKSEEAGVSREREELFKDLETFREIARNLSIQLQSFRQTKSVEQG